MRDLNEDLAFCNETEPTAFVVGPTTNEGTSLLSKGKRVMYAKTSTEELAEFIAEAREGWPEAIRRAIAAEGLLHGLVDAINRGDLRQVRMSSGTDYAIGSSKRYLNR